MTQESGPRSPQQAILMMRVIGGSLGTGVTLFALVSWFLHQQGGGPEPAMDPTLAFYGFLFMFLLASLGAMTFWRWRVAPILNRPAREQEWQARASAIQTSVIVTWAILEGAAFFGEVVYFLTGHALSGIMGVVLIWGGVLMTWPKQDWL